MFLFSVAVVGLLILIGSIIFFTVTSWVFSLVKRFILLIIIGISAYFFILNFGDKIFTENPDPVAIIIGAIGLFLALVAIFISLSSMRKSADKSYWESHIKPEYFQQPAPAKTVPPQEEVKPEEEAQVVKEVQAEHAQQVAGAPQIEPTQIQQPQMYTTQALKPQAKELFTAQGFASQITNDRSLLAVMSYIVIAQFGVFSSRTLPAPAAETGLMVFAVFMIAAFIFIKTSYHSYIKGVTHLIVAAVVGIILSVILGHYWVSIPLETLLSMDYFKTDALVAFLTGTAVSLFMGSKG